MVKLSENKFLIISRSGYALSAVVMTISNSAASFGALFSVAYPANYVPPYHPNAVVLNESTVYYSLFNGLRYAIILKISGVTITSGEWTKTSSINSEDTGRVAVRVSSTQVYEAIENASGVYKGQFLTITGTAIATGTVSNTPNGSGVYLSLVPNGDYAAWAFISTSSGTKIYKADLSNSTITMTLSYSTTQFTSAVVDDYIYIGNYLYVFGHRPASLAYAYLECTISGEEVTATAYNGYSDCPNLSEYRRNTISCAPIGDGRFAYIVEYTDYTTSLYMYNQDLSAYDAVLTTPHPKPSEYLCKLLPTTDGTVLLLTQRSSALYVYRIRLGDFVSLSTGNTFNGVAKQSGTVGDIIEVYRKE